MKQALGPAFVTGIVAALLLMAPNAFADEIVNFTLITTSNNPTPIPVGAIGTITIDTTTGVVDGIDLNIPNPATEYSIGTDSGVVDPPTINSIYFQEQWCAGTAPACLGEGGYNIVIPVDSLVGYDGGVICSTDNPCFADTSAYTFGLETIEFTSGELRATPEPSNLLLALTGVLCFGTAIYRMRTKAVRPAGGFPI